MNVIKSIITGLLISVFIILSTSFIISFVYEDEISEIFFKELNKRIEEDVKTEKINLSLLKKFPGASVEFKNFSLSSANQKDTILTFYAETIFLQFDIIELFTKDIDVTKIDINDGYLFYRTDKNVRIETRAPKDRNISLNLKKLNINDLEYHILNKTKDLEIKGFAEKTLIDGNISSNKKNLNIVSETYIEFIKIKDFPYLKDKTIEYSAGIFATPTIYKIEEGQLELENLPFEVDGSFNRKEKDIDLSITGQNIRIPELKLYLPWQIRQKYKDLVINSGDLNLFAKIQGNTINRVPNIEMDFKLSRGKVQIKKDKNLNIKDIKLSGYFTNGKLNTPRSSYLVLEGLRANVENTAIECDLELYNFLNPSLSATGQINTKLKSLTSILNISELKKEKGTLESSFSFDTYLNHPLNLPRLIENKQLTGDIALKNISFHYKEWETENLEGFIYLDNSVFYIDKLSGRLNGTNQLTFKGKVENFHRYVKDSSQIVNIEGGLKSELLNLSSLKEKKDTARKTTLNLPSSLSGDLSLDIKNLKWGNFFARNLQGNLNYHPGEITIKSLNFQTLEGKGMLSGELKQKKDNSFYLKTHSFLRQVNIHETFKTFNNFGQNYIMAENLKGSLSGEIFLSANLKRDFSIQTHTLNNVSDFTIHNGELIQFKPMNSLSSFVNLQELKHIRFSTLSNKITIKNQVINIPEMDISSSALDLSLQGYYKFNGLYQYRINLLLSEILSKKADKEVTKYGTIADDGVGKTRLYLIINGNKDKSEIKYDKDKVKEKMKTDIREEKNELKSILREEFGFFKKDSSLKVDTGKKPGDFQIEWEEEEKKKEDEKKKKKKTKSDFIIKWEEDTLK